MTEVDFLEAAMITVLQIHLEKPAGDILVFLPGQGEIEQLQELLRAKRERLLTVQGAGRAGAAVS